MKTHKLFLCGLLALLSACATATPYQPADKGYGYSEQKLESNRYRVSFVGSSKTSRETVQNYLIYRAAELTLANDYDYFVLAGQDAAAEPGTRSGSRTGVSFGLGSFGGSTGFGLGIGTGIGGGGGEDFRAQADVLMYKGEKPEDRSDALGAAEVKANLEAGIRRPN